MQTRQNRASQRSVSGGSEFWAARAEVAIGIVMAKPSERGGERQDKSRRAPE